MAESPSWNIPQNLEECLDRDADGMWESLTWSPLKLTVMKGTIFQGRPIPLAWQIEFDPQDESLEEVNDKIAELGLDPDGYGWASVILSVVRKYHPDIASELHFGDTESEVCVVWMESETTCKILMEVIWAVINN